MKLIISLVTYNSATHLSACLGSIAKQTFREYQLVCRDNCSTDDSVVSIQRLASDARVVRESENTGFSKAHNATIRETSSDYVCILNADIVLEPNYVAACISYLDAHPSVGSVTGLLIRVRALTERPKQGTIDASGITLLRTGRAVLTDAGKPAGTVSEIKQVFGVPATAAFYRRSALDDAAIDGEVFDEDFFMYKEDVDLAMRLRVHGWESVVIPSARAYHIRSTDSHLLSRPSAWINRLSYRNHWLFLLKSLPRSFWLRNGLWIVPFEIGKFFYLLLTEPRTLAALVDVWKLRTKMFGKRNKL
ncbi:MAG: glycosyltransferase family 2 protein [Patescibacteria group bacterium]